MGFILDPYTMFGSGNDGYTKSLLHFDGTDASTTFTDSNVGGSAHTWTAAGNAQLDTGIAPKFGTAAGLFDGTGDFITTPDHADFALGSSDFTLDTWFNRAGGDGTTRFICGQSNSGVTGDFSLVGSITAGNVIIFQWASTSGALDGSVAGTTTYTSTGWHHLALVRTGNTFKLFLDGTQEGGDVSYSSAINNSTSVFGIGTVGALTASSAWNGSFDEFRLSVGIARWTANFTPPTSAYF